MLYLISEKLWAASGARGKVKETGKSLDSSCVVDRATNKTNIVIPGAASMAKNNPIQMILV